MDRQKQMEDFLPARVKVEPTDDQFPFCEPAAGGGDELPDEEKQHRYKPSIQLLSISKEEVPPEQQEEWRTHLNQGYLPELLHIKEEPGELLTSQEVEQLDGVEAADIIKFTFTPVHVKNEEDDEEQPQSSQLQIIEVTKTEADGEDCGGPEPDRNFNAEIIFQPDTDDETSPSSETETDNSWEWKETSGALSASNPLRNIEEVESHTEKTPGPSAECAPSFECKRPQHEHSKVPKGKETFCCSVCGKTFQIRRYFVKHLRIHTGEKPFICSSCGTRFTHEQNLRQHMRTHSEWKPFSCSVCGKRVTRREGLIKHMRTHTGEKPYICSVCDARFRVRSTLIQHMRTHTGEKPFSCTLCGKTFGQNGSLRQHMRSHTGEKPFSCSVCDKSFTHPAHLKRHKCVGETSGSR